MYSKSKSGIEYLILKRKKHWTGWEFPKGGIENNESLNKTARRETIEETGLKPVKVKKFDYSGKYDYKRKLEDRPKIRGQTYSLYATEVKKTKPVEIDEKEHSDYKWLDFEKAFEKLTWNNQKKALAIVDEWLKEKPKFRKFITDSGKLVLAGRNEKNNEELVNQAEKEETLLHTEKPGSPFVNIKGKANKEDIKQAALFCAGKSQDWKNNKSDVIVNYFRRKDIYKEKTMKTGTFGVKNKKSIKLKKQEIEKWMKKEK